MSGLEALKYLTVKPNSIWANHGGPSWEDIAGTLAKVSDITACYGRYKYCLEHKWHNKIVEYLYHKAKKLKWYKKISDEDILVLTSLSLYEMINPSICPKCNGRKEVVILNKHYKCDICSGLGRKQMSDRSRSAYANKKRFVYNNHIKKNYFDHMIPAIEKWEIELQEAFYIYRKVK